MKEEEGIVHFWELPKNNCVILEPRFKKDVMLHFMDIMRTKYHANKVTGISRPTISTYLEKPNHKMRIDILLRILEEVKGKARKSEVEQNVQWIGDHNSQGITNPKLPFDFNSRPAARFLAAICNDGWISDGACYSNSSEELRNSVIKDTVQVFGGNQQMISEFIDGKDQYLRFPSVIRDVLCIITEFKGIKSENNPGVPSFVRKEEELICGWIEQTIADEGHIMHYPEKNRREMSWRRCFSKNLDEYKLIENEKQMLEKIGINYNFYDHETYETSKGKKRVKLQLSITRRKNLLKLRSLINIPHPAKEKAFSEMLKGYTRFKERTRIRDTIISICQEKGHVTSSSLKKEKGYKSTSTALKWLKHYEDRGLLKCIKESWYGGKKTRNAAQYALAEP